MIGSDAGFSGKEIGLELFSLFEELKREYLPLEAAEYAISLLEFQDVSTKKGGRAIKATFKIDSGEHADRRLWHFFK